MFEMKARMRFRSSFPDAPTKASATGPSAMSNRRRPSGDNDVIVSLGDRGRDDLDLPLVEADALVEFARARSRAAPFGRKILVRAGFLQHVDNPGPLGTEIDCVASTTDSWLAQHLQPFPDLVPNTGWPSISQASSRMMRLGRTAEAFFRCVGRDRSEQAQDWRSPMFISSSISKH